MVKINFYKNLLKFSKKEIKSFILFQISWKKMNVYIEYKIRALFLHFRKGQPDVFFILIPLTF